MGFAFLLVNNRTLTSYTHLIQYTERKKETQVPALMNCSLRHMDIKQCD